MDPELKALLAALTEGQVKLAEGHAKMETAIVELAADVRTFGERMDKYAEAVVRGFIAGAERNG